MHTGEVITDERALDQGLIAGDAVNAAARLQASAPTGEVLIGPETHRLVAAAVRVRRHGDLELRGKIGPDADVARRGARAGPHPRGAAAAGSAMVGRRRELRGAPPPLRTLRPDPPVRRHDGARAGRASASRGSCASSCPRSSRARASSSAAACPTARASPTGRSRRSSTTSAASRRSSGSCPATIRTPSPRRWSPARSAGRTRPRSAQDVQWAVRRLLESIARPQPLLVAFDDIQWAEPPLLDLIEYLAELRDERRRGRSSAWPATTCSSGGRPGRRRSAAARRCGCGRCPTPTRRSSCAASPAARRHGCAASRSWPPPRATRSSSSISWRCGRTTPPRPCRRASRRSSPLASTGCRITPGG